MYAPINSFLLLKPSLDIADVPEFYKLFNSYAYEVSLGLDFDASDFPTKL